MQYSFQNIFDTKLVELVYVQPVDMEGWLYLEPLGKIMALVTGQVCEGILVPLEVTLWLLAISPFPVP